MVWKALLVAAALFGAYAIFIARVRPHWSISQHQWQDNQIKGEKYIYGHPGVQAVLVGSSLAGRLNPLPGVYNLALGGQSVFDGLAIVTQHPRPLRQVLIEMNLVDREADRSFTEAINNPVLVHAKRSVLALRADKQPLAVLGQHVQMRLEPLLTRWAPAASSATPANKHLFGKMLDNQRKNYAVAPPPALLEQQFQELKTAVATLKQQGAEVVFFEMPVALPLCTSPKAVAIRAAFHRHFPVSAFRYVALPACKTFQTTDGVHLTPESATQYTRYLQDQL